MRKILHALSHCFFFVCNELLLCLFIKLVEATVRLYNSLTADLSHTNTNYAPLSKWKWLNSLLFCVSTRDVFVLFSAMAWWSRLFNWCFSLLFLSLWFLFFYAKDHSIRNNVCVSIGVLLIFCYVIILFTWTLIVQWIILFFFLLLNDFNFQIKWITSMQKRLFMLWAVD